MFSPRAFFVRQKPRPSFLRLRGILLGVDYRIVPYLGILLIIIVFAVFQLSAYPLYRFNVDIVCRNLRIGMCHRPHWRTNDSCLGGCPSRQAAGESATFSKATGGSRWNTRLVRDHPSPAIYILELPRLSLFSSGHVFLAGRIFPPIISELLQYGLRPYGASQRLIP